MKEFFKKLIASVTAFAAIVTGASLTPLAASVSAAESWVAGNGAVITVDSYPFGYHFAGSGLGGWWAECFPKLTVDGQVAYCIDSGLSQGGNGQSSGVIGSSYTAENQISLALAYGYTSKTKYGYSADTERLATQIVIWNMLDGWYDNDKEATALNYFTKEMGDSTLIANVKTVYYKIKENLKNYKIVPSFNNANVTMTYNSSSKKWTYTLYDNKSVADQFDWASTIKGKSYLSVSATANSVTFTSTKAFDTTTLNAEYSNKYFTSIRGVPVVPLAGESCEQPVVTYRSADPPTSTIKLHAEEQTGSCKLIKTSEDGKVSGIGFRLLTSGGSYIGIYYTDSNGTFTVNDLDAGEYIVVEIPRDGYVTQPDQRVTVEPGKTAEVHFNNTLKKGEMKIIKTSDDGKVEGISFNVYAKSGVLGVADGKKIGTYTTDSKGEILIPNLKTGTYIVEEIVPEGYELQAVQTVTVEENKTAAVKFKNTPKPGELHLYKHSPDGNVSGIDFIVSKEDGAKIGTYTTDENGEFLIENLKCGKYVVTEITPEGYKPQESQTVYVGYGKTATVSFYNSPENGRLKLIKTSDDGNVANISFNIYKGKDLPSESNKIGTYTTDENGEFLIENLAVGEYTIEEIVPDGYIMQSAKTVSVGYGKTTTVNFKNVKQKENSIMLTKVDEYDNDKLLSGAVFTVYKGTTASFTNIIGEMTEISPGIYIYEDLDIGTYTVKETKAPEGYELDENTYTVRIVSLSGGTIKIITNNNNGLFTNKPKPQITTLAASQSGGNAFATGIITIEDTVSYDNLIVGKEYTLKGELRTPSFDWDKRETGESFLVDGEKITAEATFTPTSTSGTVKLSFTFNTKDITENTKIVVFENLYVTEIVLGHPVEKLIASHTDINDRDQTVEIHKPEISTTATSRNEKEAIAVGTVTIDDSVAYSDLITGEEYTLKGTLMNQVTGKPFTVNGKEVTAQTVFTARSANGTVPVRFSFDASKITGNIKLVVFERLYYNGIEIAVHADINDEDQTVELHKPQIKTAATSNGEKETIAVGTVTIDDVITYSDLIVDKEYTISGVLMNKATGKAFTVNGKQITAQAKFTPKTSNGTVAVKFTFDAGEIIANTKLVAYERLYLNGIEIAAHTDINDTAQTVEIHKPKISTTATTNSAKENIAVGTITIDDVISYSDLIIGKKYTVKGVLMDKSTAAPFTVDGKEITAQAEFTPKTASGTVTVKFTFNADGITKNTKLVAYEHLYLNGVEIANHTDINDNAQTVEIHKPKISTTATTNSEKENIAVGTVTIDDVIYYSDLIIGKKYTVSGVLMDKSTAAPFTVNGKEITAQAEFTPKTTSGTVTVRFTFNADGITKNTKLVAYERLYLNGIEIAVHTDINDTAQTVELHKPEIGTTATSNGEKEVIAVGTVTIDDVISYSDLIIGKEYTVKGTLMNKATGKAFTVNSKEVTAQAKFTPTTSNGTVAVKFTFDGSAITANTKLVAYERLYKDGVEIAAHTDINDRLQTVEVHKPSIGTTATSNGEKETIGVGNVTINDTVAYHDLIIGKEYTVSGILMNKATGKPFTVGGKEVASSVKFTAEASDETVTVSFVFNADSITENTKLVVFETLYLNGTAIAVHADLSDAGQTVEIHKPKISTTATSNGEKEVIAVGTVTIDDVVSYSDLIVGKEYTVNGTLMNKTTGKPFIVNGKEVTAQAKFTPTTTNGTVTVKFTFDGSAITANTKLVAYERLYYKNVEIAVHTDINDAAQTVEVHKPSIGTTATSNGEKEAIAVGNITIVDTVAYHDLIIGKEYTVSGILMNKNTGKPFTVNGKEITSSVKFTPNATDETVSVSFTFDSSAITENTKVVAFQTLYLNGVEIANHKDINDAGQTVEIHKPSIGTTAISNGEKETIAVGTVTIDDVVSYKDLIVGKEYTVNGVLMNKTTGKAFTVNGKEVTAQAKFTPTVTNGTVTVKFTFNASAITTNTKLVAYERLYLNGVEIAVHTDINDTAQTVELHKPSIGTTAASSNGEKETIGVGTITVNDTVAYHDLIIGKEYTVNGVLMNQATGKAFIVNGKEVTSTVNFTAEATDSTVTVSFSFDGNAVTENTKLVAFQTLYLNGVEIANHKDINDAGQTVEIHKPKIGTTATANGEKETFAVGTVTIEDIVKYQDLIIGKEYTVNGVLMNKTTGKPFTVDGEQVTAQTTFTAETTDGEVTVTFTFDTSAITENTKLVAFETMSLNGVEFAVHADIEDEAQTVELKKPSISTVATINGEKDAFAVGETVIKDVISYQNLIVGKEYAVMGVLMNQATGEPFLVNGEQVTAQTIFTAEAEEGGIETNFTFDGNAITENTKLVIFETLYYGETQLTTHTDIEDENQTVEVHKPEIGTTAASNGEKEVIAAGEISINDVVAYHDLIVGKEYVVKGILMNQTTGEAFLAGGKEVTAQTTFVAEAAEETVIVTFTFDSSAITGNIKLVAFETLYLDDVVITSHEDINDEGQTVVIYKPEIGTTASSNGEKEVIAVGTVTIDDIVKYHDLIVGKEYAVNGILMNKETNEPFLVNGKEVTAQTTFTAETSDGEVTVSFTFDASGITENMTVVAFETMSLDGVEFAVHADIEDEEQTVRLVKPEISTKASTGYTVEGDKTFIVVNDVITFKNLIIGNEYTIKGVLMDKLTGQPFLVDGKQITTEKTFIAETVDGEITVSFAVDASFITKETDVVVFETVYLGKEKIAEHTDITDTEQTVSLDIPKDETPPTGVGVGMGIGAFGLASVAVVVFGKRRKK